MIGAGTRRARRLSDEEIWNLPWNSRFVALRWDLVPYGLVVDCDVPASDEEDIPVHRGWLLFEHVSEISLPLIDARLPTGIWNRGGVSEYTVDARFKEYVLGLLVPTFDAADKMVGNPNRELRVTATALKAVLSHECAEPDEYGLSYASRISLADDAALLAALELDVTE